MDQKSPRAGQGACSLCASLCQGDRPIDDDEEIYYEDLPPEHTIGAAEAVTTEDHLGERANQILTIMANKNELSNLTAQDEDILTGAAEVLLNDMRIASTPVAIADPTIGFLSKIQ